MNPQTVKAIMAAFSMRKEIKYVFYSVIIIALLPIFAVIILTQAGIDLVSGTLASLNPQTGEVEIHDPGNNSIVEIITAQRIWPISGNVTQEFGDIDLPYQPLHTGIDIASPTHQVGDPVRAFMDGTVTYADTMSWGYGRHVILSNGLHITSIYGHLDTLNVQKGQGVKVGDILGTRGTTGWSTGPHLHFQIDVFGIPVDPRVFLAGNPAP